MTSTPQIGARKVVDLQRKIGAHGFEPWTSPTRITRATRPGKQKLPATGLFDDGHQAPQTPGVTGGLPGIGHRNALCAQSPTSHRPSVADPWGPLPTASPAAVRAADQLPHTAVTTLADGRLRSLSRCSASPPRGACVRGHSHEDGSFPNRERHSRIASSTRSHVERRSIISLI